MSEIIGDTTGKTIAYTGWGLVSGITKIAKDYITPKDYETRCYNPTQQKIFGLIFFITWIIYGVAVALFWARVSGNSERDNIFHYVGSVGAVSSFLGWLVFVFDAKRDYVKRSSWPTINMTLMISFISISFACSSVLFYYAMEPSEHSGTTETLIDALTYTVFGFTVLSFFSVLFIRFAVKMTDSIICRKEDENRRRGEDMYKALKAPWVGNETVNNVQTAAQNELDDKNAQIREENRVIEDQISRLDSLKEDRGTPAELAYAAQEITRNTSFLSPPARQRIQERIENILGDNYGVSSTTSKFKAANQAAEDAAEDFNAAQEAAATGEISSSELSKAAQEKQEKEEAAIQAAIDQMNQTGNAAEVSLQAQIQAKQAEEEARQAETESIKAKRAVHEAKSPGKIEKAAKEAEEAAERARQAEEEARQAQIQAKEAEEAAAAAAAEQSIRQQGAGLGKSTGPNPPGSQITTAAELAAKTANPPTENQKRQDFIESVDEAIKLCRDAYLVENPKLIFSRTIGKYASKLSPERRKKSRDLRTKKQIMQEAAVKAGSSISDEQVQALDDGASEEEELEHSFMAVLDSIDAMAIKKDTVELENIKESGEKIKNLTVVYRKILDEVNSGGKQKMETWDTGQILDILEEEKGLKLSQKTREMLIRGTGEIERCAKLGKYKKKNPIYRGMRKFAKVISNDVTHETEECKEILKKVNCGISTLDEISDYMIELAEQKGKGYQ